MYEKLLDLRLNKFHPFRVILNDGRRFSVRDQLQFGLGPEKTSMMVALPKAGFARFKIEEIEKIAPLRLARKSKHRPARKV